MATLKGIIDFTGSIGPVSAYQRRDSDKTIIRGKGGASKKQVYNSPSMEKTRENFREFSLCGKMGGSVRRSMIHLSHLADYNFTPQLTAIAKVIQSLDLESTRGERHIFLSRHKHLLPGFSLNRKTTFESVIKPALSFEILRTSCSASLQIPELMPGINFQPGNLPFYRIILSLGAVSDRKYSKLNLMRKDNEESRAAYSPWYPAHQVLQSFGMEVQLKQLEDITDNTTLILSIGIEFGKALTDNLIQGIKYSGSAKILGVA